MSNSDLAMKLPSRKALLSLSVMILLAGSGIFALYFTTLPTHYTINGMTPSLNSMSFTVNAPKGSPANYTTYVFNPSGFWSANFSQSNLLGKPLGSSLKLQGLYYNSSTFAYLYVGKDSKVFEYFTLNSGVSGFDISLAGHLSSIQNISLPFSYSSAPIQYAQIPNFIFFGNLGLNYSDSLLYEPSWNNVTDSLIYHPQANQIGKMNIDPSVGPSGSAGSSLDMGAGTGCACSFEILTQTLSSVQNYAAVIGSAYSVPSTGCALTAGCLVGTIVFGTYYSSTGALIASNAGGATGTNGALVSQDAINAIVPNGQLNTVSMVGAFTFTNDIQLPSWIKLDLTQAKITAGAASIDLINIYNVHDDQVLGGVLNMAAVNGHAIDIWGNDTKGPDYNINVINTHVFNSTQAWAIDVNYGMNGGIPKFYNYNINLQNILINANGMTSGGAEAGIMTNTRNFFISGTCVNDTDASSGGCFVLYAYNENGQVNMNFANNRAPDLYIQQSSFIKVQTASTNSTDYGVKLVNSRFITVQSNINMTNSVNGTPILITDSIGAFDGNPARFPFSSNITISNTVTQGGSEPIVITYPGASGPFATGISISGDSFSNWGSGISQPYYCSGYSSTICNNETILSVSSIITTTALGQISDPWYKTGGIVGPTGGAGTSLPGATGGIYKISAIPISVNCTGGGTVTIKIKDSAGNQFGPTFTCANIYAETWIPATYTLTITNSSDFTQFLVFGKWS